MPTRSEHLKVICLTGGPGAGKTAVADVLRKEFQSRVYVLPETASLLYNGGFPRAENKLELKRVQSAIYYVQKQAEALALGKKTKAQILLCDRGTLDCAAYFPGGLDDFLGEVGTTLKKELSRYASVLHLETPGAKMGYDFSNPVRTESPEEALKLDSKIQKVWQPHKNRVVFKSQESFLDKVTEVVTWVRRELES
ncbi:ATP-binding protein [bacterium]|nr:ATP-binding protein [bacterium]